MLKVSLVVLAVVSLSSAAVLQEPAPQICPPPDLLGPCTCSETLKSFDCSNISGRFNIKSIFDGITPFIDPSTVFNSLIISKTSLIELPSNAISELKFLEISITSNSNLEYIYADAFTATLQITKKLILTGNHLTNIGNEEDDIFRFVRSFTNLEVLKLGGNSLTSLPSGALHSLPLLQDLNMDGNNFSTVGEDAFDLPSLTKLSFYSSGINTIPDNGFGLLPELVELKLTSNSITSISKNAFLRSPKLNKIDLRFNSLSAESFDEDTFNGLCSTAGVDLTDNRGIQYLEENVFKRLISVSRALAVGGIHCNRNGCFIQYLTCDERADWICEGLEDYQNVLSGFRCTGFGDVWKYCESLSQ